MNSLILCNFLLYSSFVIITHSVQTLHPWMDVSAVNKAAFEGNLEELTDLLSAANTPSFDINKLVDPQDSNRGPLHFAVLGKRTQVVQVLLDRFNCSPFQLDEVQ